MPTSDELARFDREGFLTVEGLLGPDDVAALIAGLGRVERDGDRGDPGVNWSNGRATTIHNLPLQAGPLAALFGYAPVLRIVERLVGGPARVTGGLLLDKDPANNWDIGWHQDNGIYVEAIPPGEPRDVRGGLPVLTTRGMELARNVTCRIALDPSTAGTGGLFVLPASHASNLGAYDASRLAGVAGMAVEQRAGDALFYRPLLLHRSEKTASASRRRTLHLQYGPSDLTLPGAAPYPWPQPCPLHRIDALA